jgi:hypothetical protein
MASLRIFGYFQDKKYPIKIYKSQHGTKKTEKPVLKKHANKYASGYGQKKDRKDQGYSRRKIQGHILGISDKQRHDGFSRTDIAECQDEVHWQIAKGREQWTNYHVDQQKIFHGRQAMLVSQDYFGFPDTQEFTYFGYPVLEQPKRTQPATPGLTQDHNQNRKNQKTHQKQAQIPQSSCPGIIASKDSSKRE